MDRRRFLLDTARFSLAASGLASGSGKSPRRPDGVTLFLCGDVMTGRGIDQFLPTPSDPRLYEPWVKSARRYLQLAQDAHGPIPGPVTWDYVWGAALHWLERLAPDARIINLETSVTVSDDRWESKGIHYRMHPANVPCLGAAAIDCCVLANNHVLDWGHAGLRETLDTLHGAGIRTAGAGRALDHAAAPAILNLPNRVRMLVFAIGVASSGIPGTWAATADRPGIRFVPRLDDEQTNRLVADVNRVRRPNDLVIISIHWGPNWGYAIPAAHRRFAHALIDKAGVSAIHGHSSHHPLGIEIYADRPILYGCGDFLNDYEGIGGHEDYRGELSLMYFPTFDTATGNLSALRIVPLRIKQFQLHAASEEETEWLRETLDRESARFGVGVTEVSDGILAVRNT